MSPKARLLVLATAVVVAGVAVFFYTRSQPPADDPALESSLRTVAADFRRIIVLMDGAESLPDAERARCRSAGRRIFFSKQQQLAEIAADLTADYRGRGWRVRQFLRWLAAPGSGLRDADRLAFLDVLDELGAVPDGPKKLGDMVRAALDDTRSIQLAYRDEVTRIFSALGTRGPEAVREKWESYVRFLREQETRAAILSSFDDGVTDEANPSDTRGQASRPNEIFGEDFPMKSVALTFDDGPHPKYTEQVTAILKKYGLRAAFFQLGINLGTVGEGNAVRLSKNAEIVKRLLEAGHAVANHSYSHRPLPKLSDGERNREISATNLLLTNVLGQRPLLFRPPYGARNQKVIDQLDAEGMKNIMWNIDSQDWADPVPESIALRVLGELKKKPKGIILFHDIHKQSVLALPVVIEELMRQEYTFFAWQNGKFEKSLPPAGTARATELLSDAAPATSVTPVSAVRDSQPPYRQSWAVIIGINEYQNWPKLKYGVNDANGVEEALVRKFGFRRENIIRLRDGDATRQRIMQVLGDELTSPDKVKRNDRLFFFFAGHGATRTLPDGRQIGFIVPADADRSNYYSTAISMTSLREACDLIPAKHIYFVMDSCYSGLALTRGGGSFANGRSYLEEVTRRTARQILTAGGAEQEVADDGPNGHSVFTWALLQGLEGRADLDGNGFITASELGSYVSPVVASFSKQTPAMGNLVGSEGGEFVFELQPEALTSMTEQLEGKALDLNAKLASLDKQIAARQAELLKLQQSIQAESARLLALSRPAGAPAAPAPVPAQAKPALPQTKQLRAYDLDRLALRLYREKKYDEAEKAARQAVALKPNDATLTNNLGFLCYRIGKFEEARQLLEKTIALDPKRKEAHGNLADAYAKLGRPADAKQHYQTYLALYPGSPRAAEVKQLLTTLN
jgi:peptidoglycan/xylan/chitin deacetylase (PgdA/CDA1 family)/uncharacterized caspase-like protein